MNRGDVVSRERIAFAVLVLLLALAAALGLELLLRGSLAAPPRLATPQPPAQTPEQALSSPPAPGAAQPPSPTKPASMPFRVTGSVRDLAPGAAKVIALTLTNPSSTPIQVTNVRVSLAAGSTPAGCSSSSNLALQQAVGITPRDPVAVPAGGSVTLSRYPRAPRIALRDLRTNQDSCQGTTFGLTYAGSAHS
jgi:hypothetical protein